MASSPDQLVFESGDDLLCATCRRQPVAFACAALECAGRRLCDQCDASWHEPPERRQHHRMILLPSRRHITWTCPHCTFINDDELAANDSDHRRNSGRLRGPAAASSSSSSSSPSQLVCQLCSQPGPQNVEIRGLYLASARAAELSRPQSLARMRLTIGQQQERIDELTEQLRCCLAEMRQQTAAGAEAAGKKEGNRPSVGRKPMKLLTRLLSGSSSNCDGDPTAAGTKRRWSRRKSDGDLERWKSRVRAEQAAREEAHRQRRESETPEMTRERLRRRRERRRRALAEAEAEAARRAEEQRRLEMEQEAEDERRRADAYDEADSAARDLSRRCRLEEAESLRQLKAEEQRNRRQRHQEEQMVQRQATVFW